MTTWLVKLKLDPTATMSFTTNSEELDNEDNTQELEFDPIKTGSCLEFLQISRDLLRNLFHVGSGERPLLDIIAEIDSDSFISFNFKFEWQPQVVEGKNPGYIAKKNNELIKRIEKRLQDSDEAVIRDAINLDQDDMENFNIQENMTDFDFPEFAPHNKYFEIYYYFALKVWFEMRVKVLDK